MGLTLKMRVSSDVFLQEVVISTFALSVKFRLIADIPRLRLMFCACHKRSFAMRCIQ